MITRLYGKKFRERIKDKSIIELREIKKDKVWEVIEIEKELWIRDKRFERWL